MSTPLEKLVAACKEIERETAQTCAALVCRGCREQVPLEGNMHHWPDSDITTCQATPIRLKFLGGGETKR